MVRQELLAPQSIQSGFWNEQQIQHEHALSPPALQVALARRRRNTQKIERVAVNQSKEYDFTQPTKLTKEQLQLIDVVTPVGRGKIPMIASHPLDKPLPNIQKIYVAQHGIMGNGPEYLQFLQDALGESFDPNTMLLVSFQLPRTVDPVDKIDPAILRYGLYGWKEGEPAVEPSPPISSFDAKDAGLLYLAKIAHNVQSIVGLDHSAGAQMGDRFIGFSKAAKELEARGITITEVISNPGHLLNFDRLRPDLKILEESGEYEWGLFYPENSVTNEWPFGMDDPPPYILDYLKEYSLETAKEDYLRRVYLAVGEEDNKRTAAVLRGGLAANAQGKTRFERVVGKHQRLQDIAAEIGVPFPDDRLIVVPNVSHDAASMFKYLIHHLSLV